MASHNGTPALNPSQRLASLWGARWRTTVPVDPYQLASQFADVVPVPLAGTWDGLLIRPPARRPTILVREMHEYRARFTVAHELGHLLIPWQCDAISFCHSAITHRFENYTVGQIEADANNFAAELLVPLSWVQQRVASATALSAAWLVELARDARVSVIVAMLSAVRACGPNHLFVLTQDDAVTYIGRPQPSHIQRIAIPEPGDRFDPSATAGEVAIHTVAAYGSGRAAHAFAFPSAVPLGVSEDSDCNGILDRMLDDLGVLDARARLSAKGVVNGIVGAVHNDMASAGNAERALAILVQRFAGPRQLAVCGHQEFRRYLECRARASVMQPGEKKRRRRVRGAS